jgi:hypothetical protein
MEAETLLKRICERLGVNPDRGESLLPLIRWALKGPEDSKARILKVIERSIEDNRDGKPTNKIELSAAADQAILVAVAQVLHTWAPGKGLI